MNARKERIPDGKGGWKLVDVTGEKKKVSASPEKIQERLLDAQEKDFFMRVGACTDSLNKYLGLYAKEHNLSPEEIIAAVYLENINNREFFPDGIEKFNRICEDVWNWFQKNKG
jgi:hypothetical protein